MLLVGTYLTSCSWVTHEEGTQTTPETDFSGKMGKNTEKDEIIVTLFSKKDFNTRRFQEKYSKFC